MPELSLPNRHTRVTLLDTQLSGRIMGYTVQSDIGYGEKPQVFAIVELDPESRGWIKNEMTGDRIAFISRMIVHYENLIW